jgi:hypothetical protein
VVVADEFTAVLEIYMKTKAANKKASKNVHALAPKTCTSDGQTARGEERHTPTAPGIVLLRVRLVT